MEAQRRVKDLNHLMMRLKTPEIIQVKLALKDIQNSMMDTTTSGSSTGRLTEDDKSFGIQKLNSIKIMYKAFGMYNHGRDILRELKAKRLGVPVQFVESIR